MAETLAEVCALHLSNLNKFADELDIDCGVAGLLAQFPDDFCGKQLEVGQRESTANATLTGIFHFLRRHAFLAATAFRV
jgi:hypothetical protein